MEEITLQALLEAGCHFGHKAERWNPRAIEFIYTKKDGIHIIDLVKTKDGLEKAREFIQNLVADGNEIVFVATKRQAKSIVKDACIKVGAPYFTEHWVGGFLTNWEEIKKNIDKVNKMIVDESTGAWKKFPKHEQTKLGKDLNRLKLFYGGVLNLKRTPQALFVVDVRKEISSVREANRVEIPVVAIVDTNSDPRPIKYKIPANDDAVGSIEFLVHKVIESYAEGVKIYEAAAEKTRAEAEKARLEAQKQAELIAAKKVEAAKAETAARLKAATSKAAEVKPKSDAKPVEKTAKSAEKVAKSGEKPVKPVEKPIKIEAKKAEVKKVEVKKETK